MAAYNSLITCSLPPAFTPLQFSFCHSHLLFLDEHTSFHNPEPDTPLPFFCLLCTIFGMSLIFLPPPFTTPAPLPFPPVVILFSSLLKMTLSKVPEALKRECCSATPAIFTNLSDLSYSRRSQSSDPTCTGPRLVAVAAEQKHACINHRQLVPTDACEDRALLFCQSGNCW